MVVSMMLEANGKNLTMFQMFNPNFDAGDQPFLGSPIPLHEGRKSESVDGQPAAAAPTDN